MVEPIRRAAPLALFRPAKPPAPSKLGAGTVLALPSGHVAGDLRLIGVDRRRSVAIYELRIANETASPLISFAYPVETATGSGGSISWSTLRVPPRTSVALPVEIPLSPRRPFLRVVAEIHGDGVHLTVDADPPSLSRRNPRTAGLVAAALLLCAFGSGAYALEPRIIALAAPHARPNALAAPKSLRHKTLHAKPALKFTLDADAVEGGNPIVVRYQAAATGTVKLLDQDGTERASALLGKRGSSIVLAPKVDVAQDFRLVIDARHGADVAETALPVRIVPAASRVAAAAAVKPPPVKAVVRASNDAPIALDASNYRAGQPITVSILHYAPNLEVTLMDDKGEELRKVAVRAEDKQLRIEAPSVMDAARFVIVATFARGAGQDSVIQPIIVRPR
jgi:hypothetical protein